jgi:predicted MFS family arabinose efflux permease
MGLFMLYPIFSIRSTEYLGATAQLTGIAAGIYGFPQALLQLPFGYLSDKFGRKPILFLGFILLALGSLICATAGDIYTLILGRALQGAGSVGSVVTATLADNTRDIVRTRAMAFLGMSIGAAFLLAIALGPSIDTYLGLAGIFWLTCGAAIFCLILCAILLPKDLHTIKQVIKRQEFFSVILDKKLLFLSTGIMLLHAILSAFFLVLPSFMAKINIAGSVQSYWYLAILTIAMLIAYKTIYTADKKHNILTVDHWSIGYLASSILIVYLLRHSMLGCGLGLLIFFTAFCILEASMPAMASKSAPSQYRGLALGFFSSAQFLGIFIGAMLGGMLNEYLGASAVIYFASGLAFVWLFMARCFNQIRLTS